MAIFHVRVDCYRRSEGRSAVGGLAYRRGIKTACEVTGKKFDFRKKEEVVFSEFINAKCDLRTHDLATIKKLFEQVETAETKCNATVGREIECALPNELTTAQQVELTKKFISRIRTEAKADEAFFDFSIHAKDGNNHVHIATSERELEATADGYKLSAKKRRDWHDPVFVQTCRKAWEEETNNALEKAGLDIRVDRRTLAAQGIEKIPTIHEGKSRHINQGERKMINAQIKDKNGLLKAPAQATEYEDLSQIYGAVEECGECENADPRTATDTKYQYRLAQQKYEGFSIHGLTYCQMKNPKYVTMWFDNGGVKSKIVDSGNTITSTGDTAQKSAQRIVELAQLKKWEKIKLSGSDAFIEEAMKCAHGAGLAVSPADEAQRKLWEKIHGEATATATQVIANTSPADVVPTLAGLGKKLGKQGDPSARTPAPKRPKAGGL